MPSARIRASPVHRPQGLAGTRPRDWRAAQAATQGPRSPKKRTQRSCTATAEGGPILFGHWAETKLARHPGTPWGATRLRREDGDGALFARPRRGCAELQRGVYFVVGPSPRPTPKGDAVCPRPSRGYPGSLLPGCRTITPNKTKKSSRRSPPTPVVYTYVFNENAKSTPVNGPYAPPELLLLPLLIYYSATVATRGGRDLSRGRPRCACPQIATHTHPSPTLVPPNARCQGAAGGSGRLLQSSKRRRSRRSLPRSKRGPHSWARQARQRPRRRSSCRPPCRPHTSAA